MINFVMVALGGALGSVLRYSAGFGVAHIWPQHLYIATVLVNILGCFLIGCAFSWFLLRPDVSGTLQSRHLGNWVRIKSIYANGR